MKLMTESIEQTNSQIDLPDYVPAQKLGKESDVYSSCSYRDEAETRRAFRRVRARMLKVNRWHSLATQTAPARTLIGINPMVPEFSLSKGHAKSKADAGAAVGDVIQISGAGIEMFVRIERIIDMADEFAIRVRTCTAEGNCSESTHMYAPTATTTFRLTRDDLTLKIGFHGRNEIVNEGLINHLVELSMALCGRDFNWSLLGEAWLPQPEVV